MIHLNWRIDVDTISLKKLSERTKIDFYQLEKYIKYLNKEIVIENNVKKVKNDDLEIIFKFIDSYSTNEISYMILHNVQPFFNGTLMLNIRKKYNLNDKQFKTKIANISLDYKYVYSDKECKMFDEFINKNSVKNRAELREMKYINDGWIPLRKVLEDFGNKYNFSVNTGKSIIRSLSINVYKPLNNLSFLSKEQKEKFEDFLKGFSSAKERKLFFQKVTCMKKYGVDNPSRSNEARNKISEKVKESCTEERQKKIEETKLRKYGKRSITDSEKSMKSRIENGTVVNKVIYKYNDLEFASSWELYFYIYQKEILKNDIQKGKIFEYEYNGNKHFYYCDFILNDENIEIKGNQFLDELNNLKQMKTREWDMCKQKCMKENNVKIISKDEIKLVIKLVKNKFGIHYIEQFRV